MTGKLWLCRSKITPYLRFAGIAERGAERLGVGHDAWQSFPLRYFGRATLSAAFTDISSGTKRSHVSFTLAVLNHAAPGPYQQ